MESARSPRRGVIPVILRMIRRGIKYIRVMIELPTVRACMVMTLGLCSTFIGYEYARAASITLLAAEETGLGTEALPLTVAVGSPASALVLFLYTKSIKKFGSRFTLRVSNWCCIVMFLIMFLYSSSLKGTSGKCAVVVFYALREIYISLLSSQQWAFISTSLDKSTSSYLVSFSGIVSVASAIGGCTVEQLVTLGGVRGLLFTSLLSTIAALLTTEAASAIMEQYHADRAARGTQTPSVSPSSSSIDLKALGASPSPPTVPNNGTSSSTTADRPRKGFMGFWYDSWSLIKSHYILQLLFFEAITHQTTTNMLNVMFHNGLRASSLHDDHKAKLVGRFFATVNVVVSLAQCFILPVLLTQSSLHRILRCLPVLVFSAVMIGVVSPGLVSVMLGFGTMKVLEYSIMHSASEMIYMPLGHEVRYLGKELVKFFGHKLGKSGASLALSMLISWSQPSLRIQSLWGCVFTVIWGFSMGYLARYLQRRDEEDADTDDDMQSQLASIANSSDESSADEKHHQTPTKRTVSRPGLPAKVHSTSSANSNNSNNSNSNSQDDEVEDELLDNSSEGLRQPSKLIEQVVSSEVNLHQTHHHHHNHQQQQQQDELPRRNSGNGQQYAWFHDVGSEDNTPQQTEQYARVTPAPTNGVLREGLLRGRRQQQSSHGFYRSGSASISTSSMSSVTSVSAQTQAAAQAWLHYWLDQLEALPVIGRFVPRAAQRRLWFTTEQRPLLLKVGSAQVSLDSLVNQTSSSSKKEKLLKKLQ